MEGLESRVLLANTSIDTPDDPITQIIIEDTGEFQFETTQVFEQSAGDGQVYQGSISKPLSGVFVRLEDGTVYGNNAVVFNAISFESLTTQARTSSGGAEIIISTFAPSDGAPFQITQEVRYTPGDVFFFVENTIQNTGQSQLIFSFFTYADANPRGRGLYDEGLGAIASIDADGQPTIVIDPLDGTSITAAEFHEEGFYSDISSKIANGDDLAFSPTSPQPPDTEESDNAIALEWDFDFIDPSVSALYAFTVGNDPVGGDTTPPPSGDDERPFADLVDAFSLNSQTHVIAVTYEDDTTSVSPSEIDEGTLDANDIFLTGPGFNDTNRFPTSFDVIDLGDGLFDVEYTFTRSDGFGSNVYDIFLTPGGVTDLAGNSAKVRADAGADPNKLGFFETGDPRLTVTRDSNPDNLKAKLLGESTGLNITNFVVRGQSNGDGDVSTGTYVNPGGVYGLSPGGGIVISTGDAGDYGSGPNIDDVEGEYFTDATPDQEALLDTLTPPESGSIDYQDVTEIDITFDLTPGVNNVFFNVVWGTEEYPEFSNADDNPDAFGLFLNGVNVALTPTLDTNDGNTFEPINAANSNLARIEGTELDGLVAVGGNPIITFNSADAAGLIPLFATGNTLTLIIADARDTVFPSTAYISALGVRDTAPVDTSNISTNIDVLAVAQQGSNLLLGGATQGTNAEPVLQRYANGTLDSSFGSGGTAQSAGVGAGSIQSIVFQGDKILVAGAGGGDFFVARYNANGTLDSSFGGGDGMTKLDIGSQFDIAFAMALDSQGRILLAGSTDVLVGNKPGSNFAIARFDANGNLDSSFNADGTPGFRKDEFTVGLNRAGSIAVQGNKFIVAGETNGVVAVARYLDNGELDTSGATAGGFDGNGKRVVDDLKTTDPIVGLAVQGDNKILIAATDLSGAEGQLTGSDFLLARLTEGGALDTTFGVGGVARTDMGGTEDPDTILLGNAGIYVLGTRATDKDGDPNNVIVNTAVALYSSSGGTTATLGSNGYLYFDPIPFNISQAASSGPGPNAIGNPFRDLMKGIGAVGANGNIVASKPNVNGAGSNVVVVANEAEVPAGPTAALTTPGTLTSGAGDFALTVTYTDANGVDVSDVGTDDITVISGGTSLVVKSATPNDNSDGSPRTVTYVVSPSDNLFDSADNGAYTISLAAGQITDTTELAANAQALGTLTVAIPEPPSVPFGPGNGSFGGRTKITAADPTSGAAVTLQLTSGTATAMVRNGKIDLQIDGATSSSALTIKSKGAVSLGNVIVNGSLKSLNGKTADLGGVMTVSGFLGKTTLASISNGTLAVASTIAALTIGGNVSNGRILAGTTLGANRSLGGGDDNFGVGSITKIAIKGAVGGSVFATGVGPGADGAYGTADDAGRGDTTSIIKSLSIKGATDQNTFFLAGKFPKTVKIPGKVVPPPIGTDPRFRVL